MIVIWRVFMFIGREKELKQLKQVLAKNDFSTILLYGRRRTGKTKLINEASKSFDGKVISYTFRDVPSKINEEEFLKFLPTSLGEVGVTYSSFPDALEHLCDKAKRERILLFLDEYSYLRRLDGGYDSYFQTFLNKYEDEANLKIIFCGSIIDSMQQINSQNAPLYGRFSCELLLHQFDYYESSLFMGNISSEDKFKYYACFGGLGYTLKNLDFSLSFEENLINSFLSPDSIFANQAEKIVGKEVNKIEEIKFLFGEIARGVHKYSDLNMNFGRIGSTKNISYLLKKLQEMDLIEKVSSINEDRQNSSLYYLKDNLLDFYYSMVFPFERERNALSPEIFYEKIKTKLETEYLPRKFEDASKEFLLRRNKGLSLDSFDSIGRYIYHDKKNKRNGEFDVVVKKDNSYTDIECKYYNRKVNLSDYLEEKKSLDSLNLSFFDVGFISKNGFEKNFPKDKIHFELDDFYKFD